MQNIIEFVSFVKNCNLGKNFVVLENGSCFVTKSSIEREMVEEVDLVLSSLKPGNIDCNIDKLNDETYIVNYPNNNIFNFVFKNIDFFEDSDYLFILGRNKLLKDMSSPKVIAFVIEYEFKKPNSNHNINRYREM